MQECDVRDDCLAVTLPEEWEGGAVVARRLLTVAPDLEYQCGFENVGTVDKCPKRRRLVEGVKDGGDLSDQG
jgi:hypothetical protein